MDGPNRIDQTRLHVSTGNTRNRFDSTTARNMAPHSRTRLSTRLAGSEMNSRDGSSNGPNEGNLRPGWVNPGGRPRQAREEPHPLPELDPEDALFGEPPLQARRPPPLPPGAARAQIPAQDRLDFDSLRGSSAGLGPMLGFLLFASRLRTSATVSDPEALQGKVEAALRRATLELPKLGWDPRYVDLALYMVCCAIDEAAQNTPWGGTWAERPLTATLSRNAIGGEKFFSQVDAMLRQPQAFETRVLELAYGCLLSGLKGQYALQPGGEQNIEVYREALLDAIRQKEGQTGSRLFDLAIPSNRPPAAAASMVPLWIPVTACLALLMIAFAGYRAWLGAGTSRVLDGLNALAASQVTLPPAPVAPRRASIDPSWLERIRVAARDAGWQVSEAPGMITVAIAGGHSFASGSDELDPKAEAPLREIADAMARLKARVQVRGHSDAQPIKSFKFQNNIELSRARAATAAAIVSSASGRDPLIEGVGEREPLCKETSSSCYARNRRVEVVASYEGSVNAN